MIEKSRDLAGLLSYDADAYERTDDHMTVDIDKQLP